jgi:inhibitor of cysteine peptidase
MRHFLLTLAGVSLLFLSGCASVQTVTEKNANDTVVIHAGDSFDVALPGNPSTGYAWEMEAGDTNVVRQLGQTEYKTDTSAPGLLGAPMTSVMRFKAYAPGMSNMRLVYHRSWERNVAPAKTFALTVMVNP